jgi:hypothetical protein
VFAIRSAHALEAALKVRTVHVCVACTGNPGVCRLFCLRHLGGFGDARAFDTTRTAYAPFYQTLSGTFDVLSVGVRETIATRRVTALAELGLAFGLLCRGVYAFARLCTAGEPVLAVSMNGAFAAELARATRLLISSAGDEENAEHKSYYA